MRIASCVILACLCGTATIATSQSQAPGGLRQLEPVRIQDTDTLFVNRGGLAFDDATRASRLGTFSRGWLGWGTAFVDLDNDS